MFTGLIKEIGIVKSVRPNQEGVELIVESKVLLPEIGIDDSVAINGACQTATKIGDNCFHVQTVHVSLEKTTLGSLRSGDEVNLELALRLQDRLGGHMVQGHVNDIAKIINIDSRGENYLVKLKVSASQMKYIVKEGSITIDGISLTVCDVDLEGSAFMVSIIPHTWNNTVLRNRKSGSAVNIEVDILGKYVENLLFHKGNHTTSTTSISEEWMRSKGF
jgi:riboflavin synthase